MFWPKKAQLVDFSCWLGSQEKHLGIRDLPETSKGWGFWYFTQVWGTTWNEIQETSNQYQVPFLEWLSDLQLEDQKGHGLNHLYIALFFFWEGVM